jgi:CRP/FNR family cyclic AMP-dependent transcriptional regulator
VRALDRNGVLRGLSTRAELELRSLGTQRQFGSGAVLFPRALFPPGPTLSCAVRISEGLVKLTATSPGGRETVLSLHGAGDLLGEEGALRHQQDDQHHGAVTRDRRRPVMRDRRVLATALTAVTACAFPPQAMSRFLSSHPEVLADVAIGLCERLEEAEARIASAGRDDANRRLAALLCDLERYGVPAVLGSWPRLLTGTELPVKLSHADLAAWIGSCPETVGRAIRGWRGRGILSTPHRGVIIVHDLEALARIAGVQVSRRSFAGIPAAGRAGE